MALGEAARERDVALRPRRAAQHEDGGEDLALARPERRKAGVYKGTIRPRLTRHDVGKVEQQRRIGGP